MDFAALSSMLNGSEARLPNNVNINKGASNSSGGKKSGATPAELKTHADHMWRFLDELAESDPAAYKKFIADQMAELESEKKRKVETEALFTPKPAFVIYTRQLKPVERTVYINICSSPQVPPLQTKDRQPARGDENMGDILIPLSVGRFVDTKDSSGKEVTISDCVFHPSVIERSTTDLTFKLFMLELCLQHLEEDEKCTLHRGYKFESPSRKYVGPQDGPSQQRTESEIEREKFIAKMKAEREEKMKQMKTQSSKPIVMPSLAKKNEAQQLYEEESIKELKLRPDEPTTSGKDGPKKKVLIEDLTPDQGEDESLKEITPAAQQISSSSSSSNKPAITLAATTKLPSKSSTSASASSSTASATTSTSASIIATSPSTASSTSSSSSTISEAPYTSKSSSSLSSDDLLSSLAAIPVESNQSSWPYGSSSASMQSTSSIASVLNSKTGKGEEEQDEKTFSIESPQVQ